MNGISNAQDLIDRLTEIAELHNVELKDLEVNFRQDFDSDVHWINWVTEYEYDSETNSKLESVVFFNGDYHGEDDEENEY